MKVIRHQGFFEGYIEIDGDEIVVEDIGEDRRIAVLRKKLEAIIREIAVFVIEPQRDPLHDLRFHLLKLLTPHLARVGTKEKVGEVPSDPAGEIFAGVGGGQAGLRPVGEKSLDLRLRLKVYAEHCVDRAAVDRGTKRPSGSSAST